MYFKKRMKVLIEKIKNKRGELGEKSQGFGTSDFKKYFLANSLKSESPSFPTVCRNINY
jgi:hypothetical protein